MPRKCIRKWWPRTPAPKARRRTTWWPAPWRRRRRWCFGAVVLVVVLAGRWERDLPPRDSATAAPLLFPLGRARWPLCLAARRGLRSAAGVPLGSLAWRAGLEGTPPAWSAAATWHHLALDESNRGRPAALQPAAGGGFRGRERRPGAAGVLGGPGQPLVPQRRAGADGAGVGHAGAASSAWG